MRKIRLTIQYDGTGYSGWQIQENEPTIQGEMEKALFTVTGEQIRIMGASRTDAGVHALEQVAGFETASTLENDVITRALNANLPHDIRVINACECPDDFHPRYSARHKIYSYLISHTSAYSVFLRRYSWNLPYTLKYDDMKEAAGFLLGTHDYSSFRASGCSSKNPVRSIESIDITVLSSVDFISFHFDGPAIKISIRARSFLRHMVRNIIGTLVETGRGKISPLKIKEILTSKDRCLAGQTAPACGLFLEKIDY